MAEVKEAMEEADEVTLEGGETGAVVADTVVINQGDGLLHVTSLTCFGRFTGSAPPLPHIWDGMGDKSTPSESKPKYGAFAAV